MIRPLALVCAFFFSAPLSHAGSNPCTITSESVLNFATGGCISQGFGSNDSIILDYSNSQSVVVLEDIDATPTGFTAIWNDITFRGTSGQPTVTLGSADPDTFVPDSALKSIYTGELTLDNIDLVTNVSFQFDQSFNELNFINAQLTAKQPLTFSSMAPLGINVLSGSSTWTDLNGTISAPTTLMIASGSTFSFLGAGLLSGKPMIFAGATTVNIDNSSTLNFTSSNMDFQSGNFNLSNNGVLNLFDAGTKLKVQNLDADASAINLGNNTNLSVGQNLSLENATITLGTGSALVTDSILFDGNNSISGLSSTSDNRIVANGLLTASTGPTVLNIEGVNRVETEFVILDSNVTLNVKRADLRVEEELSLSGATVNVTDRGTLSILSGITRPSGASLNASNNGTIFVGENANIQLESSLSLSLSSGGSVSVAGGLYTGGPPPFPTTIAGSGGRIQILGDDSEGFQGILSPGGRVTGGGGQNPIGTLITDAEIKFTSTIDVQGPAYTPVSSRALLDSGLFDGGYYQADLRVTNSIAENDQIRFGDGDVLLGAMKAIKVEVHGSPTVADLDNKQFTVIERQAGKTGQITTLGQSIDVEEGGSVPALIDFYVFDSPTEVTLLADSDTSNLLKNPAIESKNRTGSANLLINASNSGNMAIASSLNTLTNSQLPSHLESVHAEPYSSYMTISLEHTDMVMNTVLNHAARDGVFTTGRSYEAVLPRTGNFYLASTGGVETVGDVVQSHPLQNHDRFWVDASYNEGDVDGDGDLGDFEYSIQSLTIGQDLMTTNDRTIGAFFSIGSQDMDEHDTATQDFDGNNYYLGIYLNEADVGGWDLRGVLGYAFGDHDSRRTVVLSNSIATPTAGFNSHSAYVGVKGTVVGYQNDWVALSPELGLSYTYYKQKSFTESGDPSLSLTVDSADAHAIIVSAGANARFASLSETNSIYPLASVHYEYDAYADNNNEHEVNAALVSHPEYRQTFVGQNRGEHAVTFGLGLGSDPTSTLQIRGGVKYTAHSHGDEWGAGVNLQYLW